MSREKEEKKKNTEREQPAHKSMSGYWTSVLPRHFRIANSMGLYVQLLAKF